MQRPTSSIKRQIYFYLVRKTYIHFIFLFNLCLSICLDTLAFTSIHQMLLKFSREYSHYILCKVGVNVRHGACSNLQSAGCNIFVQYVRVKRMRCGTAEQDQHQYTQRHAVSVERIKLVLTIMLFKRKIIIVQELNRRSTGKLFKQIQEL